MPDEKVAITLRLPAGLKRHLEVLSELESRTFNGQLVYMLARVSRFGRWAPAEPVSGSGQARVFEPPRAGRNAPCSCGSGKKWKQCHGRGG